MWLWISIGLCCVLIFCLVLLYYAMKRITQYETVLNEIDGVIQYITEQINKIDHKGTFKSDDEVGFFFEAISTMTNLLNNLFEEEDTDAKKETES